MPDSSRDSIFFQEDISNLKLGAIRKANDLLILLSRLSGIDHNLNARLGDMANGVRLALTPLLAVSSLEKPGDTIRSKLTSALESGSLMEHIGQLNDRKSIVQMLDIMEDVIVALRLRFEGRPPRAQQMASFFEHKVRPFLNPKNCIPSPSGKYVADLASISHLNLSQFDPIELGDIQQIISVHHYSDPNRLAALNKEPWTHVVFSLDLNGRLILLNIKFSQGQLKDLSAFCPDLTLTFSEMVNSTLQGRNILKPGQWRTWLRNLWKTDPI